MKQSTPAKTPKNSKFWLGLVVGSLVQIGLKTAVPILTLVAIRLSSLQAERAEIWLEDTIDSHHPAWYSFQLMIFLGSMCAGALGASLARGRYVALACGLAMLSLLATFFEQFPLHASTAAMWIWAAGPCFGVVAGVVLNRLSQRRHQRGI